MLKCRLCDAAVADVEAAIDAGWEPSFWAGDEEVGDPVCPACVRTKMYPGDGELVLHPAFHHLLGPDAPAVVVEG